MPISTPPSFSSVRTEFNNAGMGIATNLFAYRRGGGIVPNDSYYNAIGTGAPGSPLQLSQFAGLSGSAIATLTNHTAIVSHQVFATPPSMGASSLSRLTVNSNGQLQLLGSTGWSSAVLSFGSISIDSNEYWNSTIEGSTSGEINVQNWLIGGGASQYSCRGTVQGGSTAPNNFSTFRYGTFGSWLPVTDIPQFTVQADAGESDRSNSIILVMLLEFARTNNTSTVLGSCTITLSASAEYDSGVPD